MRKIAFRIHVTMFKTFQMQAALNLDDFIKHNKEKVSIPQKLESIAKEYGENSKEFEEYLNEKGEYYYLLRDHIIGNAINCVIYSAYAIETYVNTYLLSHLSKSKFKELERKSIAKRIIEGYRQITDNIFPNDVLCKITALFERRNNIAHFKPAFEDTEIETEKETLTEKEITSSMNKKTDEELFGVPFDEERLREYVFLLNELKIIMPLKTHRDINP